MRFTLVSRPHYSVKKNHCRQRSTDYINYPPGSQLPFRKNVFQGCWQVIRSLARTNDNTSVSLRRKLPKYVVISKRYLVISHLYRARFLYKLN